MEHLAANMAARTKEFLERDLQATRRNLFILTKGATRSLDSLNV